MNQLRLRILAACDAAGIPHESDIERALLTEIPHQDRFLYLRAAVSAAIQGPQFCGVVARYIADHEVATP